MTKHNIKIMLLSTIILGLAIGMAFLINNLMLLQAKASQSTDPLIKCIGKTEEGLPLYDYTEYNRDQLMKCIILTEDKSWEAFKQGKDEKADKWTQAKWQCFETYTNLPPQSVQDPLPIGEYNKETDTFEFTHFD